MFKIEDLLSGDYSAYPEEAQEYIIKFEERFRECLKTELVKDVADRMLKGMEKSTDNFMLMLSDILENGCKGFNDMSTHVLLNLYLERRNEDAFLELLEKVSSEI